MIRKLIKHFKQPWFGRGMGGILAVTVGVGLFLLPVGKPLRDASLDLPFLYQPEQMIEDVVIIFLNERSYSELHQTPDNFDRALHARLLQRLKADGARLVVFDVAFIDERTNALAGDDQFARTLREHGKVILAGQLARDAHFYKNEKIIGPLYKFRDAAAGWGIARIHKDDYFSARAHYPGHEKVPSLAWKAAEADGAAVARNPANRDRERWLNFYAPEPFQSVAYSDVILNLPLPPGIFKDKVVFVGSGEAAGFAGEEKEQYRYPWTGASQHFPFGVEIHALTFANLQRLDWLTRIPSSVQLTLIILLGILLGEGLTFFRPWAAAGLAALAALLVSALAWLLFVQWQLWFSWLIIVGVQVPLAFAWCIFFNSLRSFMDKQFLERSMGLYLSPAQVKHILKRPDLLKPGAVQQTVSILFSDIAGFSKVSERMAPDDLVNLLNNYYETAISCVHHHEGTVMNLIGDAIFAIWNAPQEQPDHQERACRAAVQLQEKLVEFDGRQGGLPLRTRVGLHTGLVCVGNIGSSTHFDYTAIGESVNMASRLEGLNKQLGTNILATRDIQKAAEGHLPTRLVGHFKFKGFDQVIEVHEFLSKHDLEGLPPGWLETFGQALNRFQRMAFKESEALFQSVLESNPKDGPTKFYLKRVAELRQNPPRETWMGEITLGEK